MIDAYLIGPEARIRDALRQLEAQERKTLFVVDDRRTLIGSVTDGDVRRWILADGDLDGSVAEICHREPYVVGSGYDPAEVRREMLVRQLTAVPVVDAAGRVQTVITWENVFGDEREAAARRRVDLPVVIMAGGKGTRLAPFTSVLPKPLIPIGDKTVIELIVDAFVEQGVEDVYLSVNYKSKIIKSFFDELEPPYRVHYVYEDRPLGTAGALASLVGEVTTDLIVTNCDVIIRADLADLVEHHDRGGHDITLVVSPKHYVVPYGVCELAEGGLLRAIKEKPAFDLLVNTGLYVLDPAVLELIPRQETFHVTDLIAEVLGRGGVVGAYPVAEDAWIDTGEWSEYRRAAARLAADRRREVRERGVGAR